MVNNGPQLRAPYFLLQTFINISNSLLPTIQPSHKQRNETRGHFSVGSYKKITSDDQVPRLSFVE